MTARRAQTYLGHAGDRIEVRGVHGEPARRGRILEPLGGSLHRRYRVRWDDDHESIVYPADGVMILPHDEVVR